MNIVFMGTPDFADYHLKELISSKYNVMAVVTQKDKKRGRGKKLGFPPVKATALKHNIPVYQWDSLKTQEAIGKLKDLSPHLIVVVAYGAILPKEILDIPPLGCINVHASFLPKYRGAAPIQWAILEDQKKTGITTMYMDEGMDTGDIIFQQEVDISFKDTAGTLHDKLAHAGKKLLINTLNSIEKENAPRIPQDNNKATYAPKLNKEDGLIKWNKPASYLYNHVRAMNPWPGAYTFLKGKYLKVWEVSLESKGTVLLLPGTVICASKDEGIIVSTGDGYISMDAVQPAGKRIMTGKEYLLGYDIKTGDVFNEE